MQYLGEYRIDDYISFGVQLHRFSSGAVYAPGGNVTYTFYENNSTTGAPTGGNLAQLNSKTGLYTARVQLTGASGFEVGKEYFIHVEATVDSVAAAELFCFRTVANPKVDIDTIKTQSVTCAAGVTIAAYVGNATSGDTYALLVDVDTEVDNIYNAVQGIAVTGAALNLIASSATITTGTESSGTYASTYLDNGVYHVITAAGGSTNARLIDMYYDFSLPNSFSIPTQVKIVGYLKEGAPAGGDTIGLQAWNGTGWEIIEPTLFTGITTSGPDVTIIHALFSRFAFDSGGGNYKTRIRIYNSGSLEDGTTLNIDQIYISYAEAISSSVANILADTNELQIELADGGRLDLLIDDIKTKTDYLPSATAGAAGGVFIAGSNAATTLATLTVSGATTLTGALTATNASNHIHGVAEDVWTYDVSEMAIQDLAGTYLNATTVAVASLPSASTIATTILDHDVTDHTTTDTVGAALNNVGAAAPTVEQILTEIETSAKLLMTDGVDSNIISTADGKVDANASVSLTESDIETIAAGIVAELTFAADITTIKDVVVQLSFDEEGYLVTKSVGVFPRTYG